jgi:hypothetical protein
MIKVEKISIDRGALATMDIIEGIINYAPAISNGHGKYRQTMEVATAPIRMFPEIQIKDLIPQITFSK